jgi:hypothetical protein
MGRTSSPSSTTAATAESETEANEGVDKSHEDPHQIFPPIRCDSTGGAGGAQAPLPLGAPLRATSADGVNLIPYIKFLGVE